MNTLKKYIIKDETTNKFYNFITQQWIERLTIGCLNTFSEVINISSQLEKPKIKKYVLNNTFETSFIDLLLEI